MLLGSAYNWPFLLAAITLAPIVLLVYDALSLLTLPMLRLLSSKTKECKDFCKASQPCHVGIHRIPLAECSQMSTHVTVFQSFFRILLHHFVLAKLATSIRVKALALRG